MANQAGDSPEPEPGTIALRPVVLVTAIVLLAGISFLSYRCIRDTRSDATFVGQVANYAPGSVTYVAKARSYLVRRQSGSFLALSENEASDADRVAGCVIRFRPDLSAANLTGVFRDDCHGALFDSEGRPVEGNAPAMQRHPVDTTSEMVTVHYQSCTSGDAGQLPERCR